MKTLGMKTLLQHGFHCILLLYAIAIVMIVILTSKYIHEKIKVQSDKTHHITSWNYQNSRVVWLYSSNPDLHNKILEYNQYILHQYDSTLGDGKNSNPLKFQCIHGQRYVVLSARERTFLKDLESDEDVWTVYLGWQDKLPLAQQVSDDVHNEVGHLPCVMKDGANSWRNKLCSEVKMNQNINQITHVLPVKQYYKCVFTKSMLQDSAQDQILNGLTGSLCSLDFSSWIHPEEVDNGYFIYYYNDTSNLDQPVSSRINPWKWKSFTVFDANHFPRFITYVNFVRGDLTITEDGFVFKGNRRICVYSCSFHHKRATVDVEKLIDVNETVLVITQDKIVNYYHSLIEMAMKVFFYLPFLEAHPEVIIHIPGDKAWILHLFDLLNIRNPTIWGRPVRGSSVILPMGNGCHNPPVALSQYVSSYVRRLTPPSDQLSIVIINRNKKRMLLNKDILSDILRNNIEKYKKPYRIEVFDDANLPTFLDAIAMFQRAALVFGPHGAGLSNILFMKPGTFIIEVSCYTPQNRPCFRNLAYKLGLRYFGMMTTKVYRVANGSSTTACGNGLYGNVTEFNQILQYLFQNNLL